MTKPESVRVKTWWEKNLAMIWGIGTFVLLGLVILFMRIAG